jgi:hypothetical protein
LRVKLAAAPAFFNRGHFTSTVLCMYNTDLQSKFRHSRFLEDARMNAAWASSVARSASQFQHQQASPTLGVVIAAVNSTPGVFD